jgi:SAM-dependent methyltransferase
MDVLEWIQRELKPVICNTGELIYDDMESQSERSLPIIYQPFDAMKKSHWRDRGAAFDYLYSTDGWQKRLLDFGPGDGWPSLIVAPFAAEVIGVEASRRRADVCRLNAERLIINNARFVHTKAASRLPFESETFDGVMAASSVEQAPDPKGTLKELHRVLRPGGRLRIGYESLGRYRHGRQRGVWLCALDTGKSRLILYDRDIEGERVVQCGLTYAMAAGKLKTAATGKDGFLHFEDISVPFLEGTRDAIVDARLCVTIHPSGPTLKAWLDEIGFSEVNPTHSGIWMAGELFDSWPAGDRPKNLEDLDRLLKPIVKNVVRMPAPVESDPMMTAVK